MGPYLYLLGGALLIVAFFVGRSGGGNKLQARNVSGNIVVGDVSGSVSQVAAASAAPSAPAEPKPDRIAWLIGIIGVLVAVAQLGHDLLE
jgi:CDP-diglyceride synthetase